MSTRERVRRGVSRHPQTIPGLVAGVVISIGLVVGFRILTGLYLGDGVHPVTYTAVVGGGLGATAMFLVVRRFDDPYRFAPVTFWANVLGDGTLEKYREQGLYLHVTYGAVVAGFYPRVIQELMGGGAGYLFAEFPLALVTGPLVGLVLLAVAFVYEQVGFFQLEYTRDRLVPFVAAHLVYGLVLGATTGLMKPVINPLLGL